VSPDATELVERVERILRSKGLTIHQVSQRTRVARGRSSRWFIPHNLYYALRRGMSPSLHQLFALSRISDYRIYDWLRVFGLNPEHISTSQILLPSKRTFILDSTLVDPESWTPWFRTKPGVSSPQLAPLGQLLDLLPAARVSSLAGTPEKEDFVYAKIGREDTLGFQSGGIARRTLSRCPTGVVGGRRQHPGGCRS
jgi:hypothetical protein